MFVYRAIMEMAQFGDTEIESSEIKSTSQKLLAEDERANGSTSSKLGTEFTKLANIVDDRKALSVGKSKHTYYSRLFFGQFFH